MMYNARFFSCFIYAGLCVSLVIFTVLAHAPDGQASEACMECHGTMYDQELANSHVHEPFRFKKCDKCHAAELGWTNDEDIAGLSKKLRWLTRKQSPSLEHWFDFSTVGIEKVLFVEAGSGKEMLRQKIVLPELEKVMQLQNDRQPPRISDLKILDVQLGVFVTATIALKTDKVATALVNYGQNKANEFSTDTACLGREHRITLTDLKPNKVYLAQVISRDVFGNESTSDILQISTKKDFGRDDGETFRVIQAAAQKLSIAHEMFKITDRYLIRISANRPIKFLVGAMPVMPVKKAQRPLVTQNDLPEDHTKLKGPEETCIYVCYDCHQDYNKSSTHPINVGPKLGMVIPREYPTLPNGKISCMSCHSPHAKNRDSLLLKSSKKALCIGCHKDMA